MSFGDDTLDPSILFEREALAKARAEGYAEGYAAGQRDMREMIALLMPGRSLAEKVRALQSIEPEAKEPEFTGNNITSSRYP